ncbi:MAG TPA: hypothetical protein VJK66_06160 [Gaiellaceae bacterium]|nr:hypothetical protein [Gaiellaceae bacterium]
MRLSPTFFRSNAALPQGQLSEPERGEAGADSEQWIRELAGGGPDVNPELTGSAKFAVYDEMRKTDPTIKSLLWIPSLAIRGANWGLEPRDEREGLDRLLADFVAANLGLEGEDGWLDLSWSKLTQQGLEEMVWGCMLEELVWGEIRSWRDADGDEHLVRPLARLAPRLPATVSKFERATDGAIAQVTQQLPNTRPIPGSKLSYLVFEQEAGRWDGVSLLRPAWGSWRIKKALLVAAGIGWDRFAMGLPVIWHPETPEGEERAKQIGRNVRSHERAYVHFPVPSGGSKADSEWALEILNAAATLADPTPLIKLLSDQQAEAGLLNFMRLGLGETGARATAEAQANPFYLACEAIADDLRRERMRQVIRRLIEVNFGAEAAAAHCPRLTVSRIVPRDLETIARALGLLSTAGFAFTDRAATDDVRELVGFPKLPRSLEEQGISRARLQQILSSLGLDSQTFAKIVAALPEEVGLARNRAEGGPLPIGNGAGPA